MINVLIIEENIPDFFLVSLTMKNRLIVSLKYILHRKGNN